jgi:hypothetical protein
MAWSMAGLSSVVPSPVAPKSRTLKKFPAVWAGAIPAQQNSQAENFKAVTTEFFMMNLPGFNLEKMTNYPCPWLQKYFHGRPASA